MPPARLSWSFQHDHGPSSLGAPTTSPVRPSVAALSVSHQALRAVDNQIFVSMTSPARDLDAGYHAVRSSISDDIDMH